MDNKQFSKRHFTVMLAMVAALVLLAASAFATEPGAEVTVIGGTLSGGDIIFSNLTDIELDGTAKTATADWSFTNLVDARGTGAGWHTTLTLSQFMEWENGVYVESGHSLETESLYITTPSTITKAEESSSSPLLIGTAPLSAVLDVGTPVKLTSCDVGGGMGSYAISDMTVTLFVPANIYACTYKTDAVVALVSGP